MPDISVDDLLALIKAHGCRYHEEVGRYGPNGPPKRKEIRRVVNRQVLAYQLSLHDDLLNARTVRAILVVLELEPAAFGY